MTSPVAPTHTEEPTLAVLATRVARRMLPSRVSLALQLLLPWAIDFALRGWWRASAATLALVLAGAWGLLDAWLWRHHPEGMPARTGRLLRATAGALAVALGASVLLDRFLHLLGNAPIS